MKHFITTIIFSFWCLITCAQQDRFIYLQTENRQPFFVKIEGKVLNSSPAGYLIIPKLSDGIYSLVIGFPGNSLEEEFNCSINKKDVGFIIKTMEEQQWQLINVQSLNVIVPGDLITKPVTVYEKETDLFSTMLANAVNDSTILQKEVVVKIPVQKSNASGQKDSLMAPITNTFFQSDSSKNVNLIAAVSIPKNENVQSAKDTAATVEIGNGVNLKPENVVVNDSGINKMAAKETVIKDPADIRINKKAVALSKAGKKKIVKKNAGISEESTVAQKEVIKKIRPVQTDENRDTITSFETSLVRSVIKRKSRKQVKDGVEMMYVDDDGDTKDTIKILIPSEKNKKNVEKIKTDEPIVFAPKAQPDTNAKVDKTDIAKFKITKQERQIIKEAKDQLIVTSSMPNSDCKSIATDDDFLKLRKKMVAEDSDDNMIKAAKKTFKIKCFTTDQIKNLSVLFLVEQNKYMFFETAYPFVSDSDLYYKLENQLSDSDYIYKFRTMIHK